MTLNAKSWFDKEKKSICTTISPLKAILHSLPWVRKIVNWQQLLVQFTVQRWTVAVPVHQSTTVTVPCSEVNNGHCSLFRGQQRSLFPVQRSTTVTVPCSEVNNGHCSLFRGQQQSLFRGQQQALKLRHRHTSWKCPQHWKFVCSTKTATENSRASQEKLLKLYSEGRGERELLPRYLLLQSLAWRCGKVWLAENPGNVYVCPTGHPSLCPTLSAATLHSVNKTMIP